MNIKNNLEGLNQSRVKEILARYQAPEAWRSIWQLVNSVIPFILTWYLMVLSLQVSYWLTLGLSVLAAGFMVRTFIIFHDCGHYSFFKSRKANDVTGIILGVLTFTPYYHWRHDHAIHHATAGDLDRRGVGDVYTMTVNEFRNSVWWKRAFYGFWRNPLILFTVGAFLVFSIGHRFWRKDAGKKERNSVIWTNLALAGIIAGLCYLIGWQAFLLIQVPILFIATTAGVWLFYVQHNFEGTYWEHHEKWDFIKAGLYGSSFYKLPAILNWFSGNIGFHHIHHLNSRIPNYLLPKCYRENPEFHVRPLTILTSLRALRLRLWDEETRKMVGFDFVRKQLAGNPR